MAGSVFSKGHQHVRGEIFLYGAAIALGNDRH